MSFLSKAYSVNTAHGRSIQTSRAYQRAGTTVTITILEILCMLLPDFTLVRHQNTIDLVL